MKKKIWIMNHYAGQMYFNKGGRHYWFAKYLKRNGYEPVVFASNAMHGSEEFYYSDKRLFFEKNATEIDVPFVFIKSRTYKGNGIKRVLNMIDFYRNVKRAAPKYVKKYAEPDIILASSVHPLTMIAGLQLAKRYNVKCICEVRDLWPEAIVAYSKNLNKFKLFTWCLYRGERWIYKNADALIFTQEGGAEYIREKGWSSEQGGPVDMKKVYHINNGVDLEAFDANKQNYWLDDVDLDDSSIFKVIYAGAIRRINNLGIVLDIAKEIQNPQIKFYIYGDGEELEFLTKRVKNEKITNVIFKGNVNKQYIPSIVSRADLNLVHWEMNMLLHVGESYNKAFEYFAAGKPVFYTVRPGYSIAERYQCGKITDGFEIKDLVNGIEKMACMSQEEKDVMSKNARKTAELYDFTNHTEQLMKIIENV